MYEEVISWLGFNVVIYNGVDDDTRSDMCTDLMVDKNFIWLAAACNVFAIYWKAHKVFLICVASEGTNL
jgi:hypothetical protein